MMVEEGLEMHKQEVSANLFPNKEHKKLFESKFIKNFSKFEMWIGQKKHEFSVPKKTVPTCPINKPDKREELLCLF
jgi:hypothetical protein